MKSLRFPFSSLMFKIESESHFNSTLKDQYLLGTPPDNIGKYNGKGIYKLQYNTFDGRNMGYLVKLSDKEITRMCLYLDELIEFFENECS
jgi:hypothetical protein